MFRANVAALVQCQEKYIACYRADHSSWQSVQGGIEESDSSPEAAIIREVQEELGVLPEDFKIIKRSKFWRRYYFTKKILNSSRFKENIGQEQLWFLIQLNNFKSVNLENSHGEFSKVELFDLETLLLSYSSWKYAPLFDFCREIGLLNP